MSKLIDLTGQRFGRLTVVERAANHGSRVFWHCKCDCGNEKDIAGSALRYGRSTSCGCIPKEIITKRNLKHGYAAREKQERLYIIWKGMTKRCSNPNDCSYHNYGGRGIRVCDEWREYEKFREWSYQNGYSEELSIDRIDVNGNYEPENVRWATRTMQSNNTRRTIRIPIGSVVHSLKEWCDELNLNYSTVKHRLYRGVDIYTAMFTPIQSSR